ncbi:MAG: LysM peptidoglycan-binding domain-containing protein [Arhodomonas sp.]|nr:LysM peptidoglycan-binding domain-containing protein [Arhodomonas sp.]
MADAREYTVRSGDTLSEIASNHGVSVQRLRRVNGIDGDVIATGMTLQIP